jgi:ribosome-associated translation inhibitor RaiA
MQIQVKTDNHVQGSNELTSRVVEEVESALLRFGTQVTRVEVHLGDVNGVKGGNNDKRCVMEARLAGLEPIAASHHAATLEEAIAGAVDTLQRSLERTVDRLGQRKGRTSYSGEEAP